MKVIIQRVSSASVSIGNEITGAINQGILLLVGIHETDTTEKIDWMCEKILKLRIFDDEEGKMNCSVSDIGGDILIVSQFTLYGNSTKGTRPSYIEAAKPEEAEPIYEEIINYFKEYTDLEIQTGKFGAMMSVELVNDGPVTLILEK